MSASQSDLQTESQNNQEETERPCLNTKQNKGEEGRWKIGAGAMTQQLRAIAAFAEDWGFNTEAHQQDQSPSSGHGGNLHTWPIFFHLNNNNKNLKINNCARQW